MTDLISRSDVITAIVETPTKVAYRDTSASTLFGSAFRQNEIIDIINALPSADIPIESTNTPTNTPTDLISRADAINAVMEESRKVYTSEYANAERIIYEADAVEALAMLPSAEAVQGEWVICENGNKECSLCGHERQDGWDYFCGYCGARMLREDGDAE